MSLPILCRFVTRTQRPAEYQAIMVVKVSLKVRLFFSLFAIMWWSSLSCMLELPPAGVMYDYVIQLYWLWPNKKLNQHYKIWIMPFSWFINVIKQAPENRKRLKLVIWIRRKGPYVCWIRKSFQSLDPYLCSHDGWESLYFLKIYYTDLYRATFN